MSSNDDVSVVGLLSRRTDRVRLEFVLSKNPGVSCSASCRSKPWVAKDATPAAEIQAGKCKKCLGLDRNVGTHFNKLSQASQAIVIGDSSSEDDDGADVIVTAIRHGSRPLSSLIKRPRTARHHTTTAPQQKALVLAHAAGPVAAPSPVVQPAPPSPDQSRKCAICLEKMEEMAAPPCG